MLKKSKKTGPVPHILLVESDIFLADIYEKNLLMEDFKVTKVGSGEQALKILEKKAIDVILLALTLPKMNGYEVLTAIKSNPKIKNIPVVIVSKLGSKEDITKAIDLGANHFLIKSHFRPSEIVDKIKQILLQAW